MTATENQNADTSAYALSDRYVRDDRAVIVSGIQALARVPMEVLRRDRKNGLRTAAFLSGYPGSPVGGFDLEIARAKRLVPDLDIFHQPGLNEELGATSVMGSQLAASRPDAKYDGVAGFWYGKAPGLDRAGDALRHAVFAGTSRYGGAVAIVGDDPACKSSTMPSSSDATLVDLHMPILYPGTPQECIELGIHAVAVSRATGLWSALKIVTPVADGSSTVTLPVLGSDPIIPTITVGTGADARVWECHPSAAFLGARMLEVEREFREIRMPLAKEYGIQNNLNTIVVNPPDAWIGLCATGFTYYELREALRRLGLTTDDEIKAAGIRLLHLRMPVPFDDHLVREFARGLNEVIVVEEKNATLERRIRDVLYGTDYQPLVIGKKHPDGRVLMRSWDRLDADAMIEGLRERLEVRIAHRLIPKQTRRERVLIPLSQERTPYFCSGCPHNWGTKVPEGALVGAGTGCHGMTLLMDPKRVGETVGITAMGNEGAQWVGMAPFVEQDHLFQNYGDGTFLHSGQLAIQYAVSSGTKITFKILLNGTVAMTGGQDLPAELDVERLCYMLIGFGVAKIAITTDDLAKYKRIDLPHDIEVYPREQIEDVQRELSEIDGVTVLVHEQACAAELRRARRRKKIETPNFRIAINHRICEGCGDCGDKSNCLSVQPVNTPLGRKTKVDQASCNLDASCANGDCPAFVRIEFEPGKEPKPSLPAISTAEIPDPELKLDGTVRLRMTGIGGTGVVTVAAILSTAAMLDGLETKGLDQTGLSQKAGPVISDIVLMKQSETSSNLIGAGLADLLLGFDSHVGVSDKALDAIAPVGGAAILSSTYTPTGKTVTRPHLAQDFETIKARAEAVFSDSLWLLDTGQLAETLAGNRAAANILLLGVAVQSGYLPVSVASIEEAIRLNGVAVKANLQAFDWGRRWFCDPEGTEELMRQNLDASFHERIAVSALPKKLNQDLNAVTSRFDSTAISDEIKMLASDLADYQDSRYARRFLNTLTSLANAEASLGGDGKLTISAARGLHRAMAYKDEYEVARLLCAPESKEIANAVGGDGAKVQWVLHPPMLKALGMDSKMSIGTWAEPAFKALAAAKRVRGTALDPFGRTEMRKAERDLADHYNELVRDVAQTLRINKFEKAQALLERIDLVRGYEDLKMTRIADYYRDLVELKAAYSDA